MLHTKFQASEPSGFEDQILNILLCISMVQTQAPGGRAILVPETLISIYFIKDN